jgi:hypothetical protein
MKQNNLRKQIIRDQLFYLGLSARLRTPGENSRVRVVLLIPSKEALHSLCHLRINVGANP